MTLNSFRRGLYRAARLTGDVNAVKRGPTSVVKRVARKAVGRKYGSLMGRILR